MSFLTYGPRRVLKQLGRAHGLGRRHRQVHRSLAVRRREPPDAAQRLPIPPVALVVCEHVMGSSQ
jgi:hypothetical protein